MSHNHDHHHGHAHGHSHATVDPKILTTQRGIWAIKWSCVILLVVSAIQFAVVATSGSVALFADMVHNVADAGTTIPLWFAFTLARWKPSPRFTYGYGRVEDLAGVVIVLIILLSAVVAGHEAVARFFHPQPVQHLATVIAAALLSVAGNEVVARLRIKVGREIGSIALVADGQHARIDAITSLAVIVSAVAVALGFPLADPLIGLLISLGILKIVWDAGKAVLFRLLDGVDHGVVDAIRRAAQAVPGVLRVTDVRVRWVGHWLQTEVNLAVDPKQTVEQGHAIATNAECALRREVAHLSKAVVHIDPEPLAGESHHHPIHPHDHEKKPD